MPTAEKAPPATGNHGRSGSLGGIFLKREKRGFKQSAMRIVIDHVQLYLDYIPSM